VVQPIIQTAFHPEAAFRREPALHAEPEPPQAIFASYVPDTQPRRSGSLRARFPSKPRRYRSASIRLMPMPAAASTAETGSRRAQHPVSGRRGVGRQRFDEDHPERDEYVPFAIAGLMSNISIHLQSPGRSPHPPEQKDLSYLFENMDRPLAATSARVPAIRGSPAAQTFSGRRGAQRLCRARAAAPTRVAQVDR